MRRNVVFCAALAAMFSAGTVGGAASLQFDFSELAGSYTGTGPAHALSLLPGGATTWNSVGVNPGPGPVLASPYPEETEAFASNTLSFVYADGSAASGIKTDFGAFFQGTVITWNNFEEFVSGFQNTNAAPFYSTALSKDFFFNSFGAESTTAVVAFRVSGLAAGTYEVLPISILDPALGRSTNMRIGVNIDQLADDTAESVSHATLTTSWVQGENYARQLVTIGGTSDWITVFATGIGGNATFNGLQIVEVVPEPGAGCLFMLGSAFMASMVRRRNKLRQ